MIDVEAIKKRAKLLRIPLSELANRISYSEAGLHRAFLNEKMNLRAVLSIAQVLGMELSEIVTDEGMLKALDAIKAPAQNQKDDVSLTMIKELLEHKTESMENTINFLIVQIEKKDLLIDKNNQIIEDLIKQLKDKDETHKGLFQFIKGMGVKINKNSEGKLSVG
jgi:hypothetical protein